MSNKRFIELYSGNRNRTLYPNPASFEVPFSAKLQNGTPNQASDPITAGPVIYTWQGVQTLSTGTVKTASDSPVYLIPSSGNLSTVTNYYIGYTLTIGTTTRTISAYIPTTGAFTTNLPFNNLTVGQAYSIDDPSTNTIIHIPAKDIYNNTILSFSDAYNNLYIIDETLSSGSNIVYSKIISYNFTTQMATLERSFGPSWAVNDVYTIRRTLPTERWLLNAANMSNIDPTDGGAFPNPNTKNLFTTYNNYSSSEMCIPGLIMTLPSGANTTPNYYKGRYLYHIYNYNLATNSQLNPSVNPAVNGGGTYGLFYIKASQYISSGTYAGTVQLLVDYDTNSTYNPYTPNYDSSTGDGSAINIVSFIKDNFNPLNYNGNVVSQSETVCYEISLSSLTIPNQTLKTGSRAIFYPYVYVEFANATAPGGSSNDIIYSNNPASGRALFIVPITDPSQQTIKYFLSITSNMVQTVKFKPNDNLRFSVYLPSGVLFETVQTDFLSPYLPNPILQISAVFGIRRL